MAWKVLTVDCDLLIYLKSLSNLRLAQLSQRHLLSVCRGERGRGREAGRAGQPYLSPGSALHC